MPTYVTDLMTDHTAYRIEDGVAPLLFRRTASKPDSRSILQTKLSGFTLVELLITIIIVAILTSLAIPSFREFIAGQRIRTASFDIMATLVLARSEAIKRNTNVTITPATGVDWTTGWTVDVSGTTLSQQSALPGLTITCTGDCNPITYTGNGRPPAGATATSFEISSTSNTSVRCISIDLGGRPNSKTGACS